MEPKKIKWNLETPMGAMVPGDSFFVPCIKCPPLISGVQRLAKLYNIKVQVRVRFENYIKGIRVWRLE